MKKPNADIEWYDDGLSMEEQANFGKRAKLKVVVTESYHKREQDRIISELRQKLAANEEYIAELEDSDSVYKTKYNTLTKQYTSLNQKYQNLLENPELGIKKYKEEIKELEKKVKTLISVRDQLLSQLCTQK